MIRWMLQSGPDRSHLHEYKQFERLKDAKRAADELPPTPYGEDRPYIIRRLEFTPVNSIFDKITDEKIVVNNAGPAYDEAFLSKSRGKNNNSSDERSPVFAMRYKRIA